MIQRKTISFIEPVGFDKTLTLLKNQECIQIQLAQIHIPLLDASPTPTFSSASFSSNTEKRFRPLNNAEQLQILENVQHNTSLHILNLSQVDLHQNIQALEVLKEIIQHHPALTELDLTHTQLTDAGLQPLVEAIATSRTLQRVHMDQTITLLLQQRVQKSLAEKIKKSEIAQLAIILTSSSLTSQDQSTAVIETSLGSNQTEVINKYKDIFEAAKTSDIPTLRWWIEHQHRSVNSKNNANSSTLLMFAAQWADVATVRYLIDQRADVTLLNDRKDSILDFLIFFHRGEVSHHQPKLQEILQYEKVRSLLPHVGFVRACLGEKTDLFAPYLRRDLEHIHAYDIHKRSLLHYGAALGYLELIQWLVARGTKNLEAKDGEGFTALLWAARAGQLPIVEWLVAQGTNLEAKDGEGFTTLLWAARAGQLPIVEWLAAHGAKVKEVLKTKDATYKKTTLMYAAEHGHLVTVQWLVTQGAKLKVKDQKGFTALLWAAYEGHLPVVKWLAAHIAKMQEVLEAKYGYDKKTILMVAAEGGRLTTVQWLVTQGTDLEAKDENGFTALLWAARAGQLPIMEWLAAYGAKVKEVLETKDILFKKTTLMYAAECGHLITVQWLVTQGADLEAKDKNGFTALLWAARAGQLPIVEWLAAHGAKVKEVLETEESYDKKTILMIAAENGHLTTIQWLMFQGAQMDKRDIDGKTALMLAVEGRHNSIVSWWLTQRPQDIESKDYAGMTALLFALNFSRPSRHRSSNIRRHFRKVSIDMLKMLLTQGADLHVINGGGQNVFDILFTQPKRDLATPFIYLLQQILSEVSHPGTFALLVSAFKGLSLLDAIERFRVINTRSVQGETWLMWCATQGRVDEIEGLLVYRAQIFLRDTAERTALLHAARAGHITAMERLLSAGASLTDVDAAGFNGVLHAAKNGHRATLQWLITHGLSLNIHSNQQETPLLLAAMSGNLGLLQWLHRQEGGRLDVQDAQGNTMLLKAALADQPEALLWAFDQGFSDTIANQRGETIASLAQQIETFPALHHFWKCRTLLMTPKVLATELSTAIHAALTVQTQYQSALVRAILRLVVRAGKISLLHIYKEAFLPYLDARDGTGNSWLHEAAAFHQANVVKVFLAWGLSKDLTNDAGHTPIAIAVAKGATAVIRALSDLSESVWQVDSQIKAAYPTESLAEDGFTLVPASEHDKQKVVSYYQQGPVPGYDIQSVEVVYNPILEEKFHYHLQGLQNRQNNPAFTPHWAEEIEDTAHQQWRATIHQTWLNLTHPYQDGDYPAVKLLPVWHGTRSDILGSLFKTGYANLAITDSGFFGKGVYGSYEAKYAFEVYTKAYLQGVLLVNWMACFSAYPVTDRDMERDEKSNLQHSKKCKFQGKSNYANYDAHFVPVSPDNPFNLYEINYYPTPLQHKPTYHELVVFEAAACLPRYLVTLQPTLTKAPMVSKVIGHAFALSLYGLHGQTAQNPFSTPIVSDITHVSVNTPISLTTPTTLKASTSTSLKKEEGLSSFLSTILENLFHGQLDAFTSLTREAQETLLVQLDWSILSDDTQDRLLESLAQYNDWTELFLIQCDRLTNDRLQQLLTRNSSLAILTLEGCTQLTEYFLLALSHTPSTLQQLTLTHLPQLHHVGRKKQVLQSEFCVQLPQLEHLVIDNCADLTELNLNAPRLKTCHIQHSPQIQYLKTRSQQLEVLHLRDLPHLPLDAYTTLFEPAAIHTLHTVTCTHLSFSKLDALWSLFPILISLPWVQYSAQEREEYASNVVHRFKFHPSYSYAYLNLKQRHELKEKTHYYFEANQQAKKQLAGHHMSFQWREDSSSNRSSVLNLSSTGEVSAKVVDIFFSGLKHRQTKVQHFALHSLNQWQKEEGISTLLSTLLRHLTDDDSHVRDFAYDLLIAVAQTDITTVINTSTAVNSSSTLSLLTDLQQIQVQEEQSLSILLQQIEDLCTPSLPLAPLPIRFRMSVFSAPTPAPTPTSIRKQSWSDVSLAVQGLIQHAHLSLLKNKGNTFIQLTFSEVETAKALQSALMAVGMVNISMPNEPRKIEVSSDTSKFSLLITTEEYDTLMGDGAADALWQISRENLPQKETKKMLEAMSWSPSLFSHTTAGDYAPHSSYADMTALFTPMQLSSNPNKNNEKDARWTETLSEEEELAAAIALSLSLNKNS